LQIWLLLQTADRLRLAHHHALSVLRSTTSFFASKKNSLMALSMQVVKRSLASKANQPNGAQI
jgi:hypothetical protein